MEVLVRDETSNKKTAKRIHNAVAGITQQQHIVGKHFLIISFSVTRINDL